MSREIKFRCWSDEEGRYLRVQNVNFVDNKPNSMSYHKKGHKGFLHLRFPNFIFEQYTGLKDKNGKEIYEGDILKFIKDPEMARVVWNTPSAEFRIKWLECGVSDSLSWHLHDHGGAEVIGNIHEPPKDFRPEHLKRMGVSISKGGEE